MSQQGRWQERLQEFDFDIENRLEHKHGNADALSRRPCGQPECCRTTIVITRPEVQQIVEVLGELTGAADRSDSMDSEEDSQCGADIAKVRWWGGQPGACSPRHCHTSWRWDQHGGWGCYQQGGGRYFQQGAEGVSSNVADGVSSKVADGVSNKVAEGETSKMADGVSRKVAEGVAARWLRKYAAW